MEWYEWVFDGIGATVVAAICGFVGYKAVVKKIGEQSQTAGDNSKQKQKLVIDGEGDKQYVQNNIKQTQKAGDYAEQIQCGNFK